MGHLAAKPAFERLARRLDRMPVRAPDTPALKAILSELYTPAEAEVVGAMRAAPSPLAAVVKATGLTPAALRPLLDGLCRKGLVIDLWSERRGESLYAPSPFVIGVFEFTLMRSAPAADHRRRAELFREYWDAFLHANFGAGQKVSIARTLPHEAALPDESVEVLDHERASELVERAERFAVGICSCRHEKHHLGIRRCSVPLESCTALDRAADYLVRRDLAREISRREMRDLVERSCELGLVMSADNVRAHPGFICHCCGCCCNLLLGITRDGYPGTVVTSTFAARVDVALCDGCGRCVRACPVNAVTLAAEAGGSRDATRGPPSSGAGLAGAEPAAARAAPARVSEPACLGCGVCVTRCTRRALRLERRARRVLHPADTLERVILMALERGTLEELVFDGARRRATLFLKALVGGFLRLGPVQQGLMSDRLRSVFLDTLRSLSRAKPAEAAEL